MARTLVVSQVGPLFGMRQFFQVGLQMGPSQVGPCQLGLQMGFRHFQVGPQGAAFQMVIRMLTIFFLIATTSPTSPPHHHNVCKPTTLNQTATTHKTSTTLPLAFPPTITTSIAITPPTLTTNRLSIHLALGQMHTPKLGWYLGMLWPLSDCWQIPEIRRHARVRCGQASVRPPAGFPRVRVRSWPPSCPRAPPVCVSRL